MSRGVAIPDDEGMRPQLARHPVLTRITANIGVQVDGLDLARGIRHAEIDLLSSALAERLVVVIRRQFLSASQLADVAESFAPLLHSPVHAVTGGQHVHMRWRWQAGDLVIWDETSTCHRALTDHFPARRVMRRCVTAAR